MQNLKPIVKNVSHQVTIFVSRFSLYFDVPIIRLGVFLLLLGYIVNKSFLNIHSHIRTFEGFLIVMIGLALILRARDLWGNLAGFVIILVLVLAPMYWRMQGFDRDGFSLLGVFPSSDANGYFTGAIKVLYGEDIPPFAARRPLFITYLSTILFLTRQDLVLSLVVLAVIVAISLFLLVSEVKNNFGVLPAALVAAIMIYCYSGRYTGKFLTEQLGIPLGMLSLSIFLRALRQNSFRHAIWGVFVLAIALNARAGAMFVLPMLILWGSTWAWKGKLSFSKFFMLSGAVVLGFLINYWIFKSIAGPGSIPFANFGETLYGIATGYRGWRVWYQDYPGVPLAKAFGISLEIIKNSPGLFLMGMFRAYQEFLKPQYFFSFLYLPSDQSVLPSYFLLIVTIIGIWRLIKNIHLRYSRLALFVLAGILLSVPFAPPSDDAVRAMTATTSFLALIAGSAFIRFKNEQEIEHQEQALQSGLGATVYFSGLLVFLTIATWIVFKGILPVPESTKLTCNPNEQLATMVVKPRSYINVVANERQSKSFLPNIRKADLKKNLSNFDDSGIWALLRKIEPGQTLLLDLNHADEDSDSGLVWLVVPTDSVQTFNGPNSFCARQVNKEPMANGDFLVATGVENVFNLP
ncbi:MAG: hypothetical protein IPP66_10355 [Anaerolineales bacterium]|nr:hypothetical protein [Anaerolineales bacterium]